jgi:hypothetical protein
MRDVPAVDCPYTRPGRCARKARRCSGTHAEYANAPWSLMLADTTPATTCEDGPLAGNSRLCGPFFSAAVCHLVASGVPGWVRVIFGREAELPGRGLRVA